MRTIPTTLQHDLALDIRRLVAYIISHPLHSSTDFETYCTFQHDHDKAIIGQN